MKFRGRGILRTIVILPLAVPLLVAASSIVVMMMRNGTLNGVLWDWLHILDDSYPFMQTKIPVIFSEVWKLTPYAALIILAGLEAIPDSFYEAARTMGANSWQQFWKITLPLAWPAIVAAFVLRLAEVFKMFAFPVLVGWAGQGDVLSVLSWREHQAAAQAGRPQSIASAYALSMVSLALTCLVIAVAVYAVYKLIKKRVEIGHA
jgi:ABC-type sugar transport system permease subunit